MKIEDIMTKTVQSQLDQIVALIVSEVDPEQIILFGSYARGDANEHSDIDLLILKRGLNSPWGFCNGIHLALLENRIRIPVDLIPIDYDEYYKINDDIGYIYHTIKNEGKVVYGKL